MTPDPAPELVPGQHPRQWDPAQNAPGRRPSRTDDEIDDKEEDDEAGKMGFLDHLDELRKRLVISVLALVVGFLVMFAFIERVFAFIMRPLQEALPAGGTLIYTEPAEAFLLYIKIAALAGLILASPVILSQVWLFVAPGLYANEKRYAIPFVVFATLFFLSGALFSHYVVFPLAWRFFAGFSTDYMAFTPKIGPVFSLYTRLLLAFGIIFQLPTIVFFLARMGVVTAGLMWRNTKYAVLGIFIVAAVLTPTPDVVTQSLMAGPMMLLYGISIGIAWVFQKRVDE
jgi:sec-independent protein translocase protein TatC